jgi:hypothetical protein
VKASINGRLSRLELVTKPVVQEEQELTPEDRLAFFLHSLERVRQCLDAGKVIQCKGQRGRDDFYDEVWCYKCGEAEWLSVIHTIKHVAQDMGWTTSTLSAHGNTYYEHEPHTLDELRWWLDYLEDMFNEAEQEALN